MSVPREVDYLADDEQDMLLPLLRWDIFLDFVREKDDSDLVVILHRGESEGGGDLRHHLLLLLADGTEIARAADIYEQHERKLALLLVDLDIWSVVAGGDIPVDIADIIAGLILSDLGEDDAATLEGAVIFARKDILAQAFRLDLNLSDLLQKFFCIHRVVIRLALANPKIRQGSFTLSIKAP